MGLKSTVECNEECVGRPFPKLMISERGDLVLFSKSEVGVVVGSLSEGGDKTGYYCDAWFMPTFKDFKGRVILENE